MSPDPLDDATELEEQERLGGLDRVRRQVLKAPPRFNGSDCIDCEELIIAVRLQYGYFRCILCQIELDKLNRMKGIS